MNTHLFFYRMSLLFALTFLSLSASAQQILSFEPAGTIPKKVVSTTLGISMMTAGDFIGAVVIMPQVGVGITNNFDLSLSSNIGIDDIIPNITITPKVGIIKGNLSVAMPISFSSNESSELNMVLQPRLIGGYRVNKYFDITGIVEGMANIVEFESIVIGANLGMGFSTNLDRWAVRPEAGLWLSADGASDIMPDGGTLKFGLGFNYRLGKVAN